MALTARGCHLYFVHPDTPVKNNVGKLGQHIDVRGDGGYVVAAPSDHISGITYRWVEA